MGRGRGVDVVDELAGQRVRLIVAVLGEHNPDRDDVELRVDDLLDLERAGHLVTAAPITPDRETRLAVVEAVAPAVGVDSDLRRGRVRSGELDGPEPRAARRAELKRDTVVRIVCDGERAVTRGKDARLALRDVLPRRTGQGQAGDQRILCPSDEWREYQAGSDQQCDAKPLHVILREGERPLLLNTLVGTSGNKRTGE